MRRSVQETRSLVLLFRFLFGLALQLHAFVLLYAQLDLLATDKLLKCFFSGRTSAFVAGCIHALVLLLLDYLLVLVAEPGYFPGEGEFETVFLLFL